MMDSLLTAEELSRKLKISQATIYRWTQQEYIPHVRIGRSVRFKEKSVLKWLNERERKGRGKLGCEIYL